MHNSPAELTRQGCSKRHCPRRKASRGDRRGMAMRKTDAEYTEHAGTKVESRASGRGSCCARQDRRQVRPLPDTFTRTNTRHGAVTVCRSVGMATTKPHGCLKRALYLPAGAERLEWHASSIACGHQPTAPISPSVSDAATAPESPIRAAQNQPNRDVRRCRATYARRPGLGCS